MPYLINSGTAFLTLGCRFLKKKDMCVRIAVFLYVTIVIGVKNYVF